MHHIMSRPSPLQAPRQGRKTAAASQPVICQPEHLNEQGSGVQTSPWRSSWSSSWSRAPRPRRASTAWRSSACSPKTAAERPNTPGSCTCFRCLARCSPASPPPDPAPRPLPPKRLPLPVLPCSPVPPCHVDAASQVTSDALHPNQTLSPNKVNH